MKKLLSIVFLLAFFLFSCAPNATAPLAPTATSTSAPTAKATIIPTPTNTPDPSMPKGILGHDANGNYVDVQENGRTVRYYETPLIDSNGEARYHGWVASHVLDSPDNINGGIPLQDPDEGFPAGCPFDFLVQNGVLNVPYLHHTYIDEAEWGKSLSGAIYNNLKDIRFSSMPRLQFAQQFNSLSAPFSFLEKNYNWIFGKGYQFIAIPWNDADPATYPEFIQTPENTPFGKNVYRWTVFTKNDGTLVILAAVKDPSALSETQFDTWILNPMAVVIKYDQLPIQDLKDGWGLGGWPSDLVSGAATKPFNSRGLSRSYFDIQPNP